MSERDRMRAKALEYARSQGWTPPPAGGHGVACSSCPETEARLLEAQAEVDKLQKGECLGMAGKFVVCGERDGTLRVFCSTACEQRAGLLVLIEGKVEETFAAGATMRRCVDCGDVVVGGPTRCTGCVRAIDLRAKLAELEKRLGERAPHLRKRIAVLQAGLHAALCAAEEIEVGGMSDQVRAWLKTAREAHGG